MKSKESLNLVIAAGEASGDMHGSELVKEVLKRYPAWSFQGIGGDSMAQAGVTLLHHARDLGVTGFIEVFNRFPLIRRVLRDMKRLISAKPDLVILIDYPDFNFRLAKYAHKLGVPVVYYISPQIWAWRTKRVRKIKRWVAKMLVILPFEVDFYRQFEVPVTFVGHPLLAQWQTEGLAQPSASNRENLICLLPGSRINEVKRLLPSMIEAARLLHDKHPALTFEVLQADTIPLNLLEQYTHGSASFIRIVSARRRQRLLQAKLVITASGTATMEATLAGTPMIVLYKMAGLTFRLIRRLVKVPYISMSNLLANEALAPELIQDDVQPEAIVREAERFLTNDGLWLSTFYNLLEVRRKLGDDNAGARAAEAVIEVALDARARSY